ncbi:hypothetical protein KGO5_02415 [Sinorhizobium sp. KGO-5]|nr:hypothetical protein KGO5_02415 [Sinorhizobium sp. KGO-5]
MTRFADSPGLGDLHRHGRVPTYYEKVFLNPGVGASRFLGKTATPYEFSSMMEANR